MIIESGHLEPDQPRPRFAGRGWLGAALALAGAVLMFLGWFGVSGRASIGEQLPYLASGSIPGAALVVAAAVVSASEWTQRATQRTDELVAEMHALLVEEAPVAPVEAAVEIPGEPDAAVALPTGEHFHRAVCALVAGKPGVEPIDAATIDRRGLAPCSVCEPDRPAG